MTWTPITTPLGTRWLPSEVDRRLLSITRQRMIEDARRTGQTPPRSKP